MTRSVMTGFLGRRILVVEDEMLLAMMVQDLILELGGEVVGPAASVGDALSLIRGQKVDGAVLDVNLGRETVYPVAHALNLAEVPFVFVTGYDPASLEEPHRGHATIQKPFSTEDFGEALIQRLGWG